METADEEELDLYGDLEGGGGSSSAAATAHADEFAYSEVRCGRWH